MKQKYSLSILVFIAVLIISAWVYYFAKSEQKIEKLADQNVQNVQKTMINGTIQPEKEYFVQADLTGEILEMFVKEGDSVVKSQILFSVLPEKETTFLADLQTKMEGYKNDLSEIKTELEITKTEFVNAKQKSDRAKMADLQIKLNNFAQTLEKARLNVIKSENLLKESKQKLVAVNVLANTNGIISQIILPKSSKITENSTKVLVIADLQMLEIFCKISQKNMINLNLGDSAKIEVENLENKEIRGILRQIVQKNDSSEVKIKILNEYLQKNPLKVGLQAKIIFTQKI
ncbi:MAG: efflux RND transporter periplasmic adaptor subunit [Bacteroidetes bacterium]|nr:MAG: efflux RND transporter periplasmic adaptor subunit [Bacteroidota bacterium]